MMFNRVGYAALRGSRSVKVGNRQQNLHVVRTVEDMVAYHRQHIGVAKSLGFVPTMGALHAGHLSLVHKAKAENDQVAVSIFVNPKQFSAGEDLDKYPRQVEADLKLLREVGTDVVFLPELSTMYPSQSLCQVEAPAFNSILEGQARPEFFRGVATVVCKLFNIVNADRSYFGQKDISQCILVRRMVEDLNMRTKIVVCETMRDADGLAMSSRNAYLKPFEREKADILFKALSIGKALCEKKGMLSRESLSAEIMKVLKTEPLVTQVEYISIASHTDMKELSVANATNGVVLSSAIRLGAVRLIDNLLVGKAEKDILG